MSDRGALIAFGALADEGEPGDLVAEYQYDGQGRRTAKIVRQVDEQQNVTYDRTDYSYNESWQVLEERTGTFESLGGEGGARITPAETPAVQWLWDIRYVHAPVLRWRDADADPETGDFGLEETVYYCQDANWNVTALVDAATGAVAERYMYAAYGEPTVLDEDWAPVQGNQSAAANDRLFQGQESDPETGLNNVRNRIYHVTLAVFLERDGWYIDGMNLYQYCRSNPAALTDPMGLCPDNSTAPLPGQDLTTTGPGAAGNLSLRGDTKAPERPADATGENRATAADAQGKKIYVYYNGCSYSYALWAKSRVMKLLGYEVVSAGSPEEAAEGIRRIVGETGRIDVLQFESHGGPGYVAFGSPVNAESFKSGPLAGLKRNMTSDSLVVFDGCDTFRGDEGANLAKTVGAQLGCRVGGYLGYAGPQSDIDPFAGYREVKSGGTPNQGLSLAEEQRQVQSRFVHEGSTALREGANELLNGDVAAFAWNQPQRAVRTWCNALSGAAAVAGKAAASVGQAISNSVGWLRGKLGI